MLGQNQSAILVPGWGRPEVNVVYVFPSQHEFDAWAKSVQLTEKSSKLNKQAGRAGDNETTASGGWARLWDYYTWAGIPIGYGATRFYPRVRNVSTLGSFNDKASMVEVYTDFYKTLRTVISFKILTNFNHPTPGWIKTFASPHPDTITRWILSSSYNNKTSSVVVR